MHTVYYCMLFHNTIDADAYVVWVVEVPQMETATLNVNLKENIATLKFNNIGQMKTNDATYKADKYDDIVSFIKTDMQKRIERSTEAIYDDFMQGLDEEEYDTLITHLQPSVQARTTADTPSEAAAPVWAQHAMTADQALKNAASFRNWADEQLSHR